MLEASIVFIEMQTASALILPADIWHEVEIWLPGVSGILRILCRSFRAMWPTPSAAARVYWKCHRGIKPDMHNPDEILALYIIDTVALNYLKPFDLSQRLINQCSLEFAVAFDLFNRVPQHWFLSARDDVFKKFVSEAEMVSVSDYLDDAHIARMMRLDIKVPVSPRVLAGKCSAAVIRGAKYADKQWAQTYLDAMDGIFEPQNWGLSVIPYCLLYFGIALGDERIVSVAAKHTNSISHKWFTILPMPHKGITRILLEAGIPITLSVPIAQHNIEVVKWYYETAQPTHDLLPEIVKEACLSSSHLVLEWAMIMGAPIARHLVKRAIVRDQRELLRVIYVNGYEFDSLLIHDMIDHGSITVIVERGYVIPRNILMLMSREQLSNYVDNALSIPDSDLAFIYSGIGW